MANIHLILGGARSGKSRYAEKLAFDSGLQLVYVATATAGDKEMQARIEQHRQDRADDGWFTVEEPEDLSEVLVMHGQQNKCLLIDCLTLWLSNCLHAKNLDSQKAKLIQQLQRIQQADNNCHIIMVSNETGLGVVPMGELTRQFVDQSGFLHQELANLAEKVTLVVAGLPTELKK